MRHVLNNLANVIDRFAAVQFFIVTGAPKSGTTWVHKLCSSHAEIHCAGEDDFNQLLRKFADAMNGYNEDSVTRNNPLPHNPFSRFEAGDMETLMSASIAIMLTRHCGDGIKAVGSKFNDMITHNTAFFAGLFRDVPVVHVIRDPRDTLVSVHHNNHRINPEVASQRYPRLIDTIRLLGPTVRDSLANAADISAANPQTFLEIRFEDLKRDGPATAKRLYGFLGVDDSTAAAEAGLAASAFEKMSGGRKSGVEDTSSFLRKGVVGDWRDKMDPACRQAVTDVGLTEWIEKLGYDP